MRMLPEPVTRGLLVLFLALATQACGARQTGPERPVASMEGVTPTAVSDEQFAGALHEVLLDGKQSEARSALLMGVVRRQFARAAERFDAGDTERGLAAVTGALYLVRVGELHPAMLDENAARALDAAYSVIAPLGREGAAMAFLQMRSTALPANSPEQAAIGQHLAAIDAWMKDTRQRSEVENAAADAEAHGERAMLQPDAQAQQQAQAAVERWISASIDFNSTFRPGSGQDREQMLQAYRGVRTGSIVLAALYLRHGDAASAAAALERSEARRITSDELLERLDTASQASGANAWQQLAGLYAKAASQDESEELAMPQEVVRGAAWGAALAAYRREPTRLDTAGLVAALLPRLGMGEASPVVLARSLQHNPDPEAVAESLRLVTAVLLRESEAHDNASVQRIFRASAPLLALADKVKGRAQLQPSTAAVRLVMASLLVRAGDLATAKPLLEQSLSEEPSLQGWLALGSVLYQANDHRGSLEAVTKALAAPDAAGSPLGRADSHLLAFQVHRATGNADGAKTSLGQALQATLEARSRASNDAARASAERMLARLAYHYGDRDAWSRAITKTFEFAGTDRRALAMAAVEATSSALLLGDPAAAQDAVRRLGDVKLDHEDIVYPALWSLLTSKEDRVARDLLVSIPRNKSWASALARWGLRDQSDQELLARAGDRVERAEADFYIALRKKLAGDATANAKLTAVAQGPAIDLVETHLARELTLPESQRAWGPPPVRLP